MKLGAGVQRVHWNGDPGLLSSCSQGGEPGTILHGFHLLIISLYFTVLFLDKFRKKRERERDKRESSTMAVSFSFISGVARIWGALKHLVDMNKGISSPSR